jgi:hypothetical protein
MRSQYSFNQQNLWHARQQINQTRLHNEESLSLWDEFLGSLSETELTVQNIKMLKKESIET